MIPNKLKALRRKRGMTLEELAAAVGTSKQTIHRYENGMIANIPHARVAELAAALGTSPSELMGWKAAPCAGYVPLLGAIACGEPIFASEEAEDLVALPHGAEADFCLIARGDSMLGARIRGGDLVFIKRQDTVENGEIAAVIVGEEATLKRVYYHRAEGMLVLSPENPSYAPMVYVGRELEAVKILGKAVAFQSLLNPSKQ